MSLCAAYVRAPNGVLRNTQRIARGGCGDDQRRELSRSLFRLSAGLLQVRACPCQTGVLTRVRSAFMELSLLARQLATAPRVWHLAVAAGDDCHTHLTAEENRVMAALAVQNGAPPPDVLVAFGAPGAFPTFLAKEKMQRPRWIVFRPLAPGPRQLASLVAAVADGAVDELWVPSRFLGDQLVEMGVPREHIAVVPPILDTDTLTRRAVRARALGRLHLGSFNFVARLPEGQLPIWRFLVKTFLQEFGGGGSGGASDETFSLTVVAVPADWRRLSLGDPDQEVARIVQQLGLPANASSLVNVLLAETSNADLVTLYSAMDAFVLPTPRSAAAIPLLEAMALSVPVVATNWSAPAEVMTPLNSFQLAVREIRGDAAARHALPSAGDLRGLLRYLPTHRLDAAQRAKQARADVIAHNGATAVASAVQQRIEMIEAALRAAQV